MHKVDPNEQLSFAIITPKRYIYHKLMLQRDD